MNEGELREKVFRGDRFCGDEGMYGRGDLVRWLGEGRIDYVGRMDDEVKIGGDGVEWGEIEGSMVSVEEMIECGVIGDQEDSGDKGVIG